jgi:hypothetical protein
MTKIIWDVGTTVLKFETNTRTKLMKRELKYMFQHELVVTSRFLTTLSLLIL